MVGDAGENIAQPSLRIDTIELGGFDQRVGNGSRFSAPVRAHEQVVFAPDRYAAHAAFGGVVVDAETAISEIRPQPFETRQAIADCTGQG